MFKLAHLSDVHLSPLPPVRFSELISKRITGYLNWKLNRGGAMQDNVLDGLVAHIKHQNPDHIAVTGDLVNLALEEEFEKTSCWLSQLGPGESVSVIPGNHDAYVPGALKHGLSEWKPYVTGDEPDPEHLFPYLRRRGNISIIATNSGKATAPFMATGYFDRQQDRATRLLLDREKAAGQFRVVLIHHPPFKEATSWHKRLVNAERFRRMIDDCGAELILHGHTHIDSFQTISGGDNDAPVIGVPSASHNLNTQASGHHRPPARYNLFEITGSPENWSCDWSEHGYAASQSGVHQISQTKLWSNGKLMTSS